MWQPIETAPKDGTRVMLWDGYCCIASWRESAAHERFERDGEPGWQIFDCEDGWYSYCAEKPTHWMPLPAAPQ